MGRPITVGFEHLYTQLKVTNRLLAAQLRDKMKQAELIGLLSTTGATDSEIADVLNTTAGTVSVTKARLRKRNASRIAGAKSGDRLLPARSRPIPESGTFQEHRQ